jgi:hydrogenase maturation protease
MAAPGPAVVIGVGNILLHDDGVGVRVVEELQLLAHHDPQLVPTGTRLVDGGTMGLDLLRMVQGARSLLLLDAVNFDEAPGTVSVLRGDAIVGAGGRGGGATSGSVGELLAVARLMGWLPDPVSLVGVQVGDTRFGVGLSPQVEAALPGAVEAARAELRALEEIVATGRSDSPMTRQHGEATA